MDSAQLSVLLRKLPAVPGIFGRETFFNSSILVLLVKLGEEYHFIFEKRNSEIRQGGEVCFPGGMFDSGKDTSYLQTAIRETGEEIGLPAEKITILSALDTIVAPMGATIEAFLGIAEIESLAELHLNTDEVEKVFSIPVAYFEKTEPEKYQAIIRVHPTTIDEATGQEEVLFPAQQLGLPEMYYKPWGGSKYDIYLYQTEHGPIWGLTARYVYDIAHKLK